LDGEISRLSWNDFSRSELIFDTFHEVIVARGKDPRVLSARFQVPLLAGTILSANSSIMKIADVQLFEKLPDSKTIIHSSWIQERWVSPSDSSSKTKSPFVRYLCHTNTDEIWVKKWIRNLWPSLYHYRECHAARWLVGNHKHSDSCVCLPPLSSTSSSLLGGQNKDFVPLLRTMNCRKPSRAALRRPNKSHISRA
jgi:hypothetical protein